MFVFVLSILKVLSYLCMVVVFFLIISCHTVSKRKRTSCLMMELQLRLICTQLVLVLVGLVHIPGFIQRQGYPGIPPSPPLPSPPPRPVARSLHRGVWISQKRKKATPTFVFFVYFLKSEKDKGKYAKTNNLSDVLCVLLINPLNTADYQQ